MPASRIRSSNGQAPGGASLEIVGLTKTFGGATAVSSVDLAAEPGEFVTLLGASGSGKTTLLRMIAGFVEPTAGRILLDGEDITGTPVHRREIGMVFQSYALFPHMTVAKNLAFPLRMRKVPVAERRARVEEVLALLRLEGFGDRLPSQLSGGQQQRVALGRAIVGRPRLLLMDEPLGALDRRLRETMQLEITRLSRELGLTVVNVTHDQEEAFTMSDRIALLNQGELVQYAAPEALYLDPNSETAAEFLGESNLLRGTLADGERVLRSPIGGTVRVADGTLEGDVVVLVRPWSIDIRVVQPGSNAPADDPQRSSVEGVVTGVVYAGDSEKVLVQVPGHDAEFMVRQLLEARQEFAPGDPVRLSWPVASTLVLRANGVPA